MSRHHTEIAWRALRSARRWMCIGAVGIVLAACGGGGGGGDDVAPPPPPPGGSGTGADGVPVFWTLYGYNSNSLGSNLAVREAPDGGFIAAGYQTGPSGVPDLYVLKTNRLGAAQWERRIPFAGGALGVAVQPIASGGYMVAATTGSMASSRIVLVRFDASGNTVAGWPKTYGTAAREVGAMHAVNAGADGFLVVGTGDAGPPIGAGMYVMRVSLDGAVLWDKIDYPAFCAGQMGLGAAVAPTADGNYVIAGRTGCFQWAGFLLKIDAAHGGELWRKVFDGANPVHYASLEAVVATPDGGLLIGGRTGTSCGPEYAGNCDAMVAKTDASGNELWRRLYGGTLEGQKDAAAGVALAADGGYLVAGYSRSYGGTIVDQSVPFMWDDVMAIKVTATGATTWHKIKGLRPRGSDRGEAIVSVSDGGFLISGSSGGVALLAKFDKNGATASLGVDDLTFEVPTTIGVISTTNAVQVAGAGASALILPRELGGAFADLLLAASGGAAPSAFCTGGGSYAFSPPVPATLVSGSTHALSFANCVVGSGADAVRINGGTMLVVDQASGAPASGTYALQLTAANLGLTIDEPGSVPVLGQVFSGGLRLARGANAGSLTETATSPAGTTLGVTEISAGVPGASLTLAGINVRYALPAGGVLAVGQLGDTVLATAAGNTFTVSVLTAISLPSNGQPTAGVYRVTATDNSRLTASLTAGATESSAALAIDANGDGTDDGTISVPWDFIY